MTSSQIGVYGLGTMGTALTLNLAENGIGVSVANLEPERLSEILEEAKGLAGNVQSHATLEEFVAGLATPRVILFMIPSGDPMDQMLAKITPLLASGDTVIDGGNADFHLTRRRFKELADQDLHFVGMGVSGGEDGARHGPSMMVGGTNHSWTQLKPLLEAIAAKFEGAPCVEHLGPDGAGHFVKTVHNGIEYADMQMIAELYTVMRHGLQLEPKQIGTIFEGWNNGPLRSYLTEITAQLLHSDDSATGKPMVDVIKDAAGQKGTGRWTVVEAVTLGQSASTIEASVGARSWSSERETRQKIEELHGGARDAIAVDTATLAKAFEAARFLGHAQGFRILNAAAQDYDWPLDMARIAEIWRAGCIIRSALLDTLAEAFRSNPPNNELLLSEQFTSMLSETIPALRETVSACAAAGFAIPALSAALAWYETMRQGRGSAAILQGQRDIFGNHGFERLDVEGKHHGPW